IDGTRRNDVEHGARGDNADVDGCGTRRPAHPTAGRRAGPQPPAHLPDADSDAHAEAVLYTYGNPHSHTYSYRHPLTPTHTYGWRRRCLTTGRTH
ncbi:MAG: hypothetical protein QOH29_190, partial [Actinomycetota bacterium]|nr:hypothetical protein [Actinomycetota bacterium]